MKKSITKLKKLIKFLDENNMDLLSCECCNGIGIEINGFDISTMTICNKEDMRKLLNKLENKKTLTNVIPFEETLEYSLKDNEQLWED